MRKDIELILLVDQKNAIAKEGKQILFIEEDLENFKKKTWGQVLIMGRKTFDSIGRPLPGRINIVFSGQKKDSDSHLIFVSSLEELDKALSIYGRGKEVFCIGGAQLTRHLCPYIHRALLTRINREIPGADTFICDFSQDKNWRLVGKKALNSPQEEAFIEYWQRI